MENRFKFRAWNVIVYRYQYFDFHSLAKMEHDNIQWHILEFEQCTGLKDKNGKLIYEGDILKDKYGALHPISWNVKGFYEADTFAVAGFYNAIQEDMEVIGNIHENPELLEG